LPWRTTAATPAHIAKELKEAGYSDAEVEKLLEEHDVSSRNESETNIKRTRVIGALIFFPMLGLNVYYLFFLQGGWMVSGFLCAVMIYGFMLLLGFKIRFDSIFC